MALDATGVRGGAAAAGPGSGGTMADVAGKLIASHRSGGGLDAPALLADLKSQTAADPSGGQALRTAVDARLTPVERGQLAAAADGPSPAPSGDSEGVGAFFDGAVRGDFSGNNSWSKLAGQTAVGFVPIAGQIADARDTAAAIGQVWRGEEGGWLNLGAAAIGWVPGIGDAAKAAIRGGSNVAEAGADVAAHTLKQADEVAPQALKQGDEVADAALEVRKFDNAADFNKAANDATPNMRYEYGGYAYETDALGRVKISEGEIGLTATGRNDSALQADIGREGRDTDVGFHIIADRFGGQTNRLNVVPGNGKPIGDGLPNLNQGPYKQFENTVGKLAGDPKNTVEVRIEAAYDSGNTTTRPDRFEASYRVNGGLWSTQSFVNK